MKILARLACLLTVVASAACGARKTYVLEDSAAQWDRSVEGSFVIYRITMSGELPYTDVIVPDEAAARAFRSLVPERVLAPVKGADPAVSVRSVGDYERFRIAGIAPLKEKEKPQARRDMDDELGRIKADLKDHAAVVLYYWIPTP